MSNFGKSQLLKFGWTEGRGLGKEENGIAEPLRPRLKFDLKGVGHKATDDSWWQSVYNKASENISVEENSSGIALKTVDEKATIFSKNEDLKQIQKKYSSGVKEFIKTSTLENGRIVQEKQNWQQVEIAVNNLTISDEDLLRACGGRTAHKGARHGLNLSGKLARIALQEESMASSFTKIENTKNKVRTKKKKSEKEESDLKQDCINQQQENKEETTKKKEKKEKKRKRKAIDTESEEDIDEDNRDISHLMNTTKSSKNEMTKHQRKSCKKKINNLVQLLDKACTLEESDARKSKKEESKKKKKKANLGCEDASDEFIILQTSNDVKKEDEDFLDTFKDLTFKRYEEQNPDKFTTKKHKKSKRKCKKNIDKLSDQLSDLCSLDEKKKKKKKKEYKKLINLSTDDDSKMEETKLKCGIEKKKKKSRSDPKTKRKIELLKKDGAFRYCKE